MSHNASTEVASHEGNDRDRGGDVRVSTGDGSNVTRYDSRTLPGGARDEREKASTR